MWCADKKKHKTKDTRQKRTNHHKTNSLSSLTKSAYKRHKIVSKSMTHDSAHHLAHEPTRHSMIVSFACEDELHYTLGDILDQLRLSLGSAVSSPQALFPKTRRRGHVSDLVLMVAVLVALLLLLALAHVFRSSPTTRSFRGSSRRLCSRRVLLATCLCPVRSSLLARPRLASPSFFMFWDGRSDGLRNGNRIFSLSVRRR